MPLMTEEMWSVQVQKVIMPFANAISLNVQMLDSIFSTDKAAWDDLPFFLNFTL